MSPGPVTARFHEARRDGMPMDVGLFWEPDPEDLARRLHNSEADRALRLARIEEVWADRTVWIDRYNEVDAIRSVLTRERDALLRECAGLRLSVVQARDLRAREQHYLSRERAAADAARDGLAAERDAALRERDRLAAEREDFVAERAALLDHIAAVEADREAVRSHRDAQVASREAAEARLSGVGRNGWARLLLAPLRHAARRILGV